MITSLLNCMMKIMMVFFLLRIFIYFLLLFLTHYHYGNLAPLSCIHSTILSFNSLTPAFPENVVTTPTGGISYNTFIGLWTLLLRYESTLTLYTLLQLGYWKDVHTLIRIIDKEQHDRHLVHCCIIGDHGVGKVGMMRCYNG